jgi:hypothetical protein
MDDDFQSSSAATAPSGQLGAAAKGAYSKAKGGTKLMLWIGVGALPVMLLVLAYAAVLLKSNQSEGNEEAMPAKADTIAPSIAPSSNGDGYGAIATTADEQDDMEYGGSSGGGAGITAISNDDFSGGLDDGMDDGMGDIHVVSDLRERAIQQAEQEEQRRRVEENKAVKARARARDAERATAALEGAKPALDDGMDDDDDIAAGGGEDDIYQEEDYLMDDI